MFCFHFEEAEVVDPPTPPVPNLVLLEGPQFFLLLHLHQSDVFGPLVGPGCDELTEEKKEQADAEDKDQHRDRQSVQADSIGLDSGDLVVPGQSSKGHEGGQEDHGRGCLRDDHGNHKEEVGDHLVNGCAIAHEHPDFTEKIYNQIDGDDGKEEKDEDLQKFLGQVAVQGVHGLRLLKSDQRRRRGISR